jgi:hypothetical protein
MTPKLIDDSGWYMEGEDGEPYCYRPMEDTDSGVVHVLKFHSSRTVPSTSWVGGHIYNHTLCKLSANYAHWDRMSIAVVGTPVTCPECAEKFAEIGVLFNKSMEVSLVINGQEWTCATKTHALEEIQEAVKSGVNELTRKMFVKNNAEGKVYEVKLRPELVLME